MTWAGELFGALALLAVGFNYAAWKADRAETLDPTAFSLLLLFTWSASNLAIHLDGPDGAQWFSTMDGLCGLIAFWSWSRRRAGWKAALVVSFALMGGAHVAFGLASFMGGDFIAYARILNALYLLQLLIVGWPGLSYGWDRALGLLVGDPPDMRRAGR